jgi:ABC-type enterochelin transport system ATPase subunit
MNKIRLYDLSKELNLENKEILDICEKLDIPVKSHHSLINESDAERIRSVIKTSPLDQIKNISIKGFRRLQEIDLPMKRLTVLIGENGSGKTSFLDIFSILSASARGDLQNTLQLKGGLNDILTRGKVKELEISVEMDLSYQNPLQYNLILSPQRFSYMIKEESLTQQPQKKTDHNHFFILIPTV